jgi:hypothetical protein
VASRGAERTVVAGGAGPDRPGASAWPWAKSRRGFRWALPEDEALVAQPKIATLERREAPSRRTGGKASRLASATKMPVTRLRRSAAPRFGVEKAKRKERTRGRQRAAGRKKTALFDIVNRKCATACEFRPHPEGALAGPARQATRSRARVSKGGGGHRSLTWPSRFETPRAAQPSLRGPHRLRARLLSVRERELERGYLGGTVSASRRETSSLRSSAQIAAISGAGS